MWKSELECDHLKYVIFFQQIFAPSMIYSSLCWGCWQKRGDTWNLKIVTYIALGKECYLCLLLEICYFYILYFLGYSCSCDQVNISRDLSLFVFWIGKSFDVGSSLRNLVKTVNIIVMCAFTQKLKEEKNVLKHQI